MKVTTTHRCPELDRIIIVSCTVLLAAFIIGIFAERCCKILAKPEIMVLVASLRGGGK